MKKIICYTDGGSRGNPGPSGLGAYVIDENKKVLKEVAEFLGNGTNNFAEYQAVVVALQTLKKMFGKKTKEMEFEIRMDSELIQKQLNNEYQIKEPGLIPQFIEIHNMCVSSFPQITFTHVRREKNVEADRLANEAMDSVGQGQLVL